MHHREIYEYETLGLPMVKIDQQSSRILDICHKVIKNILSQGYYQGPWSWKILKYPCKIFKDTCTCRSLTIFMIIIATIIKNLDKDPPSTMISRDLTVTSKI